MILHFTHIVFGQLAALVHLGRRYTPGVISSIDAIHEVGIAQNQSVIVNTFQISAGNA